MKRRLGPAWLAVGEDGKPHLRRGRVKPDFLDERRAYARMAEVITQCEDEARGEEIDAARKRAGWTFGALADAWLDHAERVRRLKPSTMRDLRASSPARVSKRRGGGAVKARLMTMLERPRGLDRRRRHRGLLPPAGRRRRVPADRQPPPRGTARDLQLRLFDDLGLRAREQPRRQTDLRRQDGPRPLEVFSVEQVEHLARSAADGSWRAAVDWMRAETVAQMMPSRTSSSASCCASPATAACVAASSCCFSGTTSAGPTASSSSGARCPTASKVLPKSGRERYVPLADQALAALRAPLAARRLHPGRRLRLRQRRRRPPRPVGAAPSLRPRPRRRRPAGVALRPAPYRRLAPRPPHGSGERQGHPRPRRPGDDRALPARAARVAAGGRDTGAGVQPYRRSIPPGWRSSLRSRSSP